MRDYSVLSFRSVRTKIRKRPWILDLSGAETTVKLRKEQNVVSHNNKEKMLASVFGFVKVPRLVKWAYKRVG